VKRIQLGNTVFEGENDVYLLDGETTALVDTGVALPDVRGELEAGLAEYGLGFADVDAIALTHWHPDHAGLAGEIQAESDADVYVHEADARRSSTAAMRRCSSIATSSARRSIGGDAGARPRAADRLLRRGECRPRVGPPTPTTTSATAT